MFSPIINDVDYDLVYRIFKKIYDILPPKEAISLEYADEKTDIYDSKIGGVPYFPSNIEYPSGKFRLDEYLYTKDSKLPMMFVAQINFEQLPHLQGYPDKGILQFYSSGVKNRDYGMIDLAYKPDMLLSANEFRVIYHETVITDRAKLMSENDFFPLFQSWDDEPETGVVMPVVLKNEDLRDIQRWYRSRCTWYIDRPYKLKSKGVHSIYPDVNDYRFEPLFLKYYYAEKDYPLETVEEIRSIIYEESQKVNQRGDVLLGGYPYFADIDPRHSRALRKYDTLLFEMLSSNKAGISVEVNGEGTLSYLISSDNLGKRIFSDVMIYGDSV